MIDVYSPRSETELLLLRSILDDAGVHYFVKNDVFGSLTIGPQIELYNRKTLCVADSDADEARHLIRGFLLRIDETDNEGAESSYTLADKLRMVAEVLFFGWIIPGRRRHEKGPRLRLVKGTGVPDEAEKNRRSAD